MVFFKHCTTFHNTILGTKRNQLPAPIDLQLITDCVAGNRTAQRQLYDQLLPPLEMVGRRYLRTEHYLQDVLQESFVSIFKNLRQFDLHRASFKTWSCRIVINNCLKYNARVDKSTIELVVKAHEQSVEASVMESMNQEELLTWLQQMPFQYYEVFNLHLVDGFSHDEIAKMIQISPALSRKRLSRARAWIKKRTSLYESTSTPDFIHGKMMSHE